MSLVLLVAVCFLGLSLLGQRAAGLVLRVPAPVRPLWPFAAGVSPVQQVLVRLAGVAFTWLILFAAAAVQSAREEEWTTKVEVVEGLPASKAGLRSGDTITHVNHVPVADFGQLKTGLAFGGRQKALSVRRGEQQLEVVVDAPDSVLGLKRGEERVQVARGEALLDAATLPVRALALVGRELPNGVLWLSFTAALAWWVSVALELLAFLVNWLTRALP